MSSKDDKDCPDAPPSAPDRTHFPRRRLGRIVHDERGMASMEWEQLDPDETGPESRQPLRILDGPVGGRPRSLPGGGVNPYAGAEPDTKKAGKAREVVRKPKDLRKLSEWILQQREVAKRKAEEEDR